MKSIRKDHNLKSFFVFLFFIVISVLIAYASTIMTTQMYNFDEDQVAGIIQEAGSCEIKADSYLQKEFFEQASITSVNDLVAEANTLLQQFIGMIETELQVNYPGGFAAWRSEVISPPPIFKNRGMEYDELVSAYNSYGQEMVNFNSKTTELIRARQDLGTYALYVILSIEAEAVLFVIPGVGTQVVLITMGATFLSEGWYSLDLVVDIQDAKNDRTASSGVLNNQFLSAASEGEDIKFMLVGTPYWTSSINEKWGEFIDKNIEVQTLLQYILTIGGDCETDVFYIHNGAEYWYNEEIWVKLQE